MKIVKGDTDRFYDMIIEFYDAFMENGEREFQIELLIKKDVDYSLLHDFVSLVNDLSNDWGGVAVEFKITEEGSKIDEPIAQRP